MIPTVQITGEPDQHPEKMVFDASELAAGKIDISKLKVIRHQSKVFDLMDDSDRNDYDSLYVELSDLANQGKIVISSNVREVLTRADGSTGWFKFIEWSEFDTSEILGA